MLERERGLQPALFVENVRNDIGQVRGRRAAFCTFVRRNHRISMSGCLLSTRGAIAETNNPDAFQ